ncbi:coat protein F [Effusibacillus dendaii]|uniref:Spore coat protein n=1 Tax=Effusibacillus dendaii TaxID=2743772 RepID=A0A7I8DHT5_9BACL|nr:coat protein F [Effusibacillus dendaii]BCJ88486.1 hypothetical protein skT53_34710 [Effusibacillus dendaii]
MYPMPYYVPVRDTVSSSGHLAPHETLELHEILAFKTNGLMRQKMALPHIHDPELRRLYMESMTATERHIREIVELLQHRPMIS